MNLEFCSTIFLKFFYYLVRFMQGLREHFHSEVIEACHRSQYKIPPVSEFIPFRRRTVGAAFLWGEFSSFHFYYCI